MIYLRDKPLKKKPQTNICQQNKRNIFHQLKSRINKNHQQKQSPHQSSQDITLNQNQRQIQNSKSIYSIAKKSNNAFQKKTGNQICIRQSINNSNVSNQPKQHKEQLTLSKCYDIQIVNLLGSTNRLEGFIKMLEDQNKTLKKQLQLPSKSINNQSKLIQLQQKLAQQQAINKNIEENLTKHYKFYQQGRNTILMLIMQLLQSKNTMFLSTSRLQKQKKIQQINKSIEKGQKTISLYQELLQQKQFPNHSQMSVQQLNALVRCQQKMIQKYNQSNGNTSIQQCKLLRYEINRLSQENQSLKIILTQNQHKFPNRDQRPLKDSVKSCFVAESASKSSTPINDLNKLANSKKDQSVYVNSQDQQFKQIIQERNSKISNLQIEKDYLVDQLSELQIEIMNLRKQIKYISQLNTKLQNQSKDLQNKYQESLKTIEYNHEQLKVLEVNKVLLSEKIRHLQNKSQSIKHSHFNDKSTSQSQIKPRGQDKPKCQSISVQNLLRFLNKKQLKVYHQTLLQLINHYQIKISQLNQFYVNEKEIKDKHMTYCKIIYNMINAKTKPSLESLIKQISNYTTIISQVEEDQIDILLRKIKSFTIGINKDELEIIHTQLGDYVSNLMSRLPVLEEEYLKQDGSSVSDSFQVSIQTFQ